MSKERIDFWRRQTLRQRESEILCDWIADRIHLMHELNEYKRANEILQRQNNSFRARETELTNSTSSFITSRSSNERREMERD